MFLAACIAAVVMTGCKKDTPNVPDGGKGKFLIETTVKNPEGMSGSSFLQLVSDISGSIDNSNAIPLGFSSPVTVVDSCVFIFPTMGKDADNNIKRYTYNLSAQKLTGMVKMDVPANTMPINIIKVTNRKAYVPFYTLGVVWIVDIETMQKTGEIDLKPYSHKDSSPEPAFGIVRDGLYYLPLDQINENFMPYEDYRQVDVAVIDTKTDKVQKIISEKTSKLSFPTRPMLRNMIFTDEHNDIYIACAGNFGLNPTYLNNGFVCIPAGSTEFDVSKSWDIKDNVIIGTDENYKPASIFNCKYIGNGKVAAYVNIIELNGENPYTSKNSMAVIIDMKAKTITRVKGVPLSDSHSVVVEFYKGQVFFGAYGDKQAGFFTYNPADSEAKHVCTTTGNPIDLNIFK